MGWRGGSGVPAVLLSAEHGHSPTVTTRRRLRSRAATGLANHETPSARDGQRGDDIATTKKLADLDGHGVHPAMHSSSSRWLSPA